jgi:hypothetical protein
VWTRVRERTDARGVRRGLGGDGHAPSLHLCPVARHLVHPPTPRTSCHQEV